MQNATVRRLKLSEELFRNDMENERNTQLQDDEKSQKPCKFIIKSWSSLIGGFLAKEISLSCGPRGGQEFHEILQQKRFDTVECL